MVKIRELAISKAAELPEAAQEQLGRELLERLDSLAELRAELESVCASSTRGGASHSISRTL
jgi:hypothetical protein